MSSRGKKHRGGVQAEATRENPSDHQRRQFDWVKWGGFILAVFTAIQLQCERLDRRAHEHTTNMANAFRLGRRVSIYEANLKWVEVLTSRSMSPESLRAHEKTIAELKARGMGGAEVAAAAAVLGINLNSDETLEDLERRAWGQVSDSFTESAQRSYRLGRMLGRYDERASLLFVLAPRRKNTYTPELLDTSRRSEWLKEVASLLDELGIHHAPLRAQNGLWACATDGRALLNAVAEHFAAEGRRGVLRIEDPSTRTSWKFFAVVAHEPGYFGRGSVQQIWPDSLSSADELGYNLLLNASPDSAGYSRLWNDLKLPHAN